MVINGKNVEGTPKQAQVTVNGKVLKLTLVYIGEGEVPEAKFNWTPVEGVAATTTKVGNRVATELKVGKKTIFTNLTAQSVFAVVEAKYGQAPSKTDSIYKKANPARKESKQGTAATVTVEAGEW